MKTIINTSYPSKQLSQLEKEVLHLMAYDYTIAEMTLELKVSEEIIKTTQSELCAKLEVEHMSGLIRVAYEQRILLLYG